MNLRSENPMRLMAAEHIPEKQECRFLFFYPNDETPEDWRTGTGAMLIIANPTIRVPGDQDEDEYELPLENLPQYVEVLTGNEGIPVGIGFSKDEAQIVDYDGPVWLFHMKASSYGYSGTIDLGSTKKGQE